MWHNQLWLIDHGASLYFHHSWTGWEKYAVTPFIQIKDHVLLPQAANLETVDRDMKALLSDNKIKQIIDLIPSDWLEWQGYENSEKEKREIYYQFLTTRRDNSENFIKEAQNARKILI